MTRKVKTEGLTKLGHRRVRRGNQVDAEALRLILIEEAHRLFREGGLGALTMRNLAAKAQVAPMTPYTYFKNKSDILGHIKNDIALDLLKTQMESVRDAKSAREALLVSTKELWRFWIAQPENFRLMFDMSSEADDTLTWGAAASLTILDLRDFDHMLAANLASEIGGHVDLAEIAARHRHATVVGSLQLSMLNRDEFWTSNEAIDVLSESIVAAMESLLMKRASKALRDGLAGKPPPLEDAHE